jgi:hypothetical protein
LQQKMFDVELFSHLACDLESFFSFLKRHMPDG